MWILTSAFPVIDKRVPNIVVVLGFQFVGPNFQSATTVSEILNRIV